MPGICGNLRWEPQDLDKITLYFPACMRRVKADSFSAISKKGTREYAEQMLISLSPKLCGKEQSSYKRLSSRIA